MIKRAMAVTFSSLILAAGVPKADEVRVSTTTAVMQQAEFLRGLSAAAKIPLDELKPLNKPGLGRIEVLVLALLHKKTGADLAGLLEQRKKKVRLSRLINLENQDERGIYQEAWALRKQIEGK